MIPEVRGGGDGSMASKAQAVSDPSREAQIDAALKALFEALENRATPPVFHALVDQLEGESVLDSRIPPTTISPADRRGLV